MFSIVTISFNQANYLKECIDSVLAEPNLDFQYIIVDAGSTDGSREIISGYSDRRILRVFERDDGPADGLNKGLSLCVNPYFYYLNSDDTVMPGALAMIAEEFARRPDVAVIYGNAFMIDGDGKTVRKLYSDKFSLRRAAYGMSVTIQPSTFFRLSSVRAVGGFNVENRSNWDGELLIDMALAGVKMAQLRSFLSSYRVHSMGITGSGKLKIEHEKYTARMFAKVNQRSMSTRDVYLRSLYRFEKHLSNPRALLERMKYGPVFGAEAQ